MTSGRAKHQMIYALNFMMSGTAYHQRYDPPARTIALLRENLREAAVATHKGKVVSVETRVKQSLARKGKPSGRKGERMSEQQKAKISATLKARNALKPKAAKPVLDKQESNRRRSEALKGRPKPWAAGREPWNKGVQHSDKSIAKMKAAHADRPVVTCEHCGKTVQKPMYARWHGGRCSRVV